MGIMDKKVCIVTGGAGSIGQASAAILLEEGAKVMLVDKNFENLSRALNQLNDKKDQVAAISADVASSNDVQNYIDQTVERWGNIDVIFSNAGISGVISPITDYPEDVFDEVMAVNVRGSFLACKYSLPKMNDGGSIIISSSIMGVTADPGVTAYVASKHALIGLARVVAKEAAPRNIRVNIVAPGPIDNSFQAKIEKQLTEVVGQDGTEFLNGIIPLGHHGHPEEIAQMVLFLASSRSSFCTGSIFNADGGMNI